MPANHPATNEAPAQPSSRVELLAIEAIPVEAGSRPRGIWPLFAPTWNLAARGRRGLAFAHILLWQLVVVGGSYLLVLNIARARGVSVWDSTGAVDRWMPALPWAIVVYFTLYLYFPLTLLLAPRGMRGIEALLLHLQAQAILTASSLVVFLTLPTEIHVRQEMEAALASSTSFAQPLYEQLYWVDSPWNAWPSLHVSLSLLMLLCWLRFTRMNHARHELWPRGKGDTLVIAIAVPCWIALCWSILATKQHFFFDIWTGALAGWLVWRLYLRRRIERCDAPLSERVA